MLSGQLGMDKQLNQGVASLAPRGRTLRHLRHQPFSRDVLTHQTDKWVLKIVVIR